VGAQDVGFEVLQRCSFRGKYDPWLEGKSRSSASKQRSGQDAQEAWKKANGYPLQTIRDYRNKLVHGRTPPALVLQHGGMLMPTFAMVDKYCDWRKVTGAGARVQIAHGDFESPATLLRDSWHDTVQYLEAAWQRVLL
jgi:hypothetical protein